MLSNNKRFIINIFGISIRVYGIAVLPALIVSLVSGETDQAKILLIAMLITVSAGYIIDRVFSYELNAAKPRVYYFTTLFTWSMLILITAFIYFFSIDGMAFSDAIFDATASWTTTGTESNIYEDMPASMQLLRATFNWIGGVGIILITISFLPKWNFTGHLLAVTELPGPDFLKTTDSFKRTYRLIIRIYSILTILEFILLLVAGMPVFTSILTALSGISTAGMQHISHGIITGLPALQRTIIVVFTLFGSVNYSVFVHIAARQFRRLRHASESIFFISRILFTSIMISIILMFFSQKSSIINALTSSLSQVISFVSTSGFIATKCDTWPTICQVMLLLQMFIGACALSTGGGIKVGRIMVGNRTMAYSMYRHIHPKAIRKVSITGNPLSEEQIINANLFIFLFMMTFIAGSALLSIETNDVFRSLYVSQSMLTNVGTSINELSSGAPGVMTEYGAFSKIVMSLLMLAGRLEIYPLLMVLFRSFWISDSNL